MTVSNCPLMSVPPGSSHVNGWLRRSSPVNMTTSTVTISTMLLSTTTTSLTTDCGSGFHRQLDPCQVRRTEDSLRPFSYFVLSGWTARIVLVVIEPLGASSSRRIEVAVSSSLLVSGRLHSYGVCGLFLRFAACIVCTSVLLASASALTRSSMSYVARLRI